MEHLDSNTDLNLRKDSSSLQLIAHEIKTPIINIIYQLELLKKDSSEKSKENFSQLEKTCNFLLNLIDKYTNYEKLHIEEKQTSAQNLIDNILNNLCPKTKKEFFKINFLPSCNNDFFVDPVITQQIIYNLLHNSIKYAKTEKVIVDVNLIHKFNKHYIEIDITDDQTYIPKDIQQKIFEKSYQKNEQNEGLGMGLYICQQLCNKINGTIECKSSKKSGTTFSVTIPIKVALNDDKTPSSSKKEGMEKPTQNELNIKNILIVEDDIVQQTYLNRMLKELLSPSCIDVINTINEENDLNNYDLIILDLYTNDFDNIEKLKNYPYKENIIATSAMLTPKTAAKLIHFGFKYLLTKPITKDKLLNCLIKRKQDFDKHISSENTLSSINWHLAFKRANHNKDLAISLLDMFFEQLPDLTNKIIKSYNDNDNKKLSSLLHYLHGSCCYLGLPKLENIVNVYEKVINKDPSSISSYHNMLLHEIKYLQKYRIKVPNKTI